MMMSPMLACGPYFSIDGFYGSIALFLIVKPLAYFAFIQAFRYRVSRPIPMRTGQAVQWTVLRSVLGMTLIGAGALALYLTGFDHDLVMVSWGYLYAERVFSWWVVGRYGPEIRGRRLVGWVISGTLINAAFDGAVVLGLLEGAGPQLAIVAAIAVFIGVLHVVGRRDSLKRRFADSSICHGCGYDLTGNLSGRCPECGQLVAKPALLLS